MNALLTRSCLSCSRTSKFWDIRWARNVGKRCLSLTTKVNSNLYNRNQVNSRLLSKNVSGLLQTRFYSDFPPHEVLALPALSPTMETGTIARWEVKEGDSFEVGDLLAEIETDKATLGFEAADEGVLAKILVPSGAKNIEIGTPVAIIVDDESHVAKFANYTLDSAKASASSASSAPTSEPSAPVEPTPSQPATPATPSTSYPSHTVVDLPALSPTMTSGSLVTWEIKVGDHIEEGDAIAMIETDKASVALEVTDEGYLAKILVGEGTKDLQLGTPLCVVVENESDVSAFKDFKAGEASQSAAPAVESPPASVSPPKQQKVEAPVPVSQEQIVSSQEPPTGRLFASPFARKLANDKGIDINLFAGLGSGPSGRIVAADLNKTPLKPAQQQPLAQPATTPIAATQPFATGDYTDIDVTNVRKVIANRLCESKQKIPHYYLTTDIEMDQIMEVRKNFNDKLQKDGSKLSVNDFIIKAAALSCLKVPETNSQWNDTFIRQFKTVDMSVAVSTDNGLITPIVFDAQTKGLKDIATEVKDLATRARNNKLKPEEFMGGTFTISNLGMYGVKHFSAVINPPQSCILAVGGARKELVPDENDKVRVATVMSVTLSCDHRTVDGAVGAMWLKEFKYLMQNPIHMLL